jgi:hypothetical protein
MIALDEALVMLARLDDRKSRLVELRFFGGLTAEETAEVPGDFRADRAPRMGSGARLAFSGARRDASTFSSATLT